MVCVGRKRRREPVLENKNIAQHRRSPPLLRHLAALRLGESKPEPIGAPGNAGIEIAPCVSIARAGVSN